MEYCPDLPYMYQGTLLKALPISILVPDPKLEHNLNAISFSCIAQLIETISNLSVENRSSEKKQEVFEATLKNRNARHHLCKSYIASHTLTSNILENFIPAKNSHEMIIQSNWLEGFNRMKNMEKLEILVFETSLLQAEKIKSINLKARLSLNLDVFKKKALMKMKNKKNKSDHEEKVQQNKDNFAFQQLVEQNASIQKEKTRFYNSFYKTHTNEQATISAKQEICHRIIIMPPSIFSLSPYQPMYY